MKKLLALLLAAVMTLALAACGGGNAGNAGKAGNAGSGGANAGSNAGSAAPEDGGGAAYLVGICQYAPHPALDAATQGFKDALNELLPGQVEIDEQNAAGDSPTCATIANGFVSANVDLIMANATEYGVALGIDNFSGTVGSNVSGTSDLAPLEQQAAMVQEWFPDARNVGLLYCSGEPNSKYQVDTVQGYLEELGYACTQYPFADTNDMASVTQTAAGSSDVIYVPTDNTVANNTGVVDNICRPLGIPIIAGEEGICGGCGVATLSISYYDIGYKTGEMAAKILTGEADISAMPIEYAPQFTKKYNETICSGLDLTPLEGYEPIAPAE